MLNLLLATTLLLSPAQADVAQRVDAVVERAMQRDGFVGLSVAVGIDGNVVHARGYGLAEVEHEVPADEETIFRIGSISKQFTAAAICRLAEQDRVVIDADMHEYIEFPTQGRTVTVRHLLTHTSGIPSYTGLGPEWSRTMSIELSQEELLALVADKPFDFEPGARFAYNNTGYFLLGVIIEKVTGTSYADYIRTAFVEPLGLQRTRYGSNRDIIPNRAQGYQWFDGQIANDELIGMSQPYAAGSLISTAQDLVTWGIALSKGQVILPESYEEMTTPYQFEDATDTSYGFGLFLRESNGRPCVFHGGGINGFNSMLRHYPSDGVTIAVISNSESFDSDTVANELARELLK